MKMLANRIAHSWTPVATEQCAISYESWRKNNIIKEGLFNCSTEKGIDGDSDVVQKMSIQHQYCDRTGSPKIYLDMSQLRILQNLLVMFCHWSTRASIYDFMWLSLSRSIRIIYFSISQCVYSQMTLTNISAICWIVLLVHRTSQWQTSSMPFDWWALDSTIVRFD